MKEKRYETIILKFYDAIVYYLLNRLDTSLFGYEGEKIQDHHFEVLWCNNILWLGSMMCFLLHLVHAFPLPHLFILSMADLQV